MRFGSLVVSLVAITFAPVISQAWILDDSHGPVVAQKFASLPLGFEQNVGQVDGEPRFVSRGFGYSAYFSRGEALLTFDASMPGKTAAETVRIVLVGADTTVEPQGIDVLPGVSHYYIGNDPRHWRTGVRQFREVRYHNVYPGIDLVFYGNHHQMEFDFDIAPGADVSAVKLRVEGANLRKQGPNLELITPLGNQAVLKRPEFYQGEGTSRHIVSGGYHVRRTNEIAFTVGSYNHKKSLVVDPALIYSTLVQLSNAIQPFAVAVDKNGSAYLTGQATPDSTHFSAFVLKFDPSGSSIVYQTFLGGTQSTSLELNDIGAAGYGLQVDGSGNAFFAGMTHEIDFPTTSGAYSTANICATATNVGCLEPFAAKLDANGNLVFSTFLVQPAALDTVGPVPSSIAIDSNGALYVTGSLALQGFDSPVKTAGLTTTPGTFQTTRNQNNNSAGFVLKLHPDGSSLDYATYLGGSTGEVGGGIAVDSTGVAYVDGGTSSSDFPCANPPASSSTSAFFTKLQADGSAQLFSTFLGGPDGQAKATSIGIDSDLAVYMAGMTVSGGFPQPQVGQGFPAFAAKFDSSGNLLYSQLLATGIASGLTLTFNPPPQSFIAPLSRGRMLPILPYLPQAKPAGQLYQPYPLAAVAHSRPPSLLRLLVVPEMP